MSIEADLEEVKTAAMCQYCGRTHRVDGYRTCAGCGAPKPENPMGNFWGYAIWDFGLAYRLMSRPEYFSWTVTP